MSENGLTAEITYRRADGLRVPSELCEQAGFEEGEQLVVEVTPLGVAVHPPVRSVQHAFEGEEGSYSGEEFSAELADIPHEPDAG